MEKAAKTVKGRNGGTLTPMQPGETKNPNGRPKSVKYLTELLKSEMEGDGFLVVEGTAQANALKGRKVKVKIKIPNHQQIIRALLAKAGTGDTKAIEIILDRVEGKVPLPLKGDSEDPLIPPLPAAALTEKAIEKLIEKL